MSDVAIKIEGLSKQYRLGQVGTGTISHDLNRWWHQVRGKEDPYLKIGQSNDRTQAGGDYVWALKDINFEVKQGEVLGIIGKNGAGKSTLLKLLSKVTSPTTGRIKARGRIASLLEVGTGFHPEMTGRENIFMNGTIMGMSRHGIKTQLDEIVDFAGIAKYLDTPVKRYSSGMMVRLGFAIAAHLEPEILIVDEVLAVGDIEFQNKAIGKMQDVSADQGRTVLLVSHNMALIDKLCSNSLILDRGEIGFQGDSTSAINKYRELNISNIIKYNFSNRTILSTAIVDFSILNQHKREIYDFPNDVPVLFFLQIRSKEKLKFTTRITIFNSADIRVLAFDSNLNSLLFNTEQKEFTTLNCDISDGLGLKPDTYYINISIKQGSKVLDHIVKVVAFTIEPSSFFEQSIYNPSDAPLFYKKCKWDEI